MLSWDVELKKIKQFCLMQISTCIGNSSLEPCLGALLIEFFYMGQYSKTFFNSLYLCLEAIVREKFFGILQRVIAIFK